MSADNIVKASFVFGRSTKTRGLHQWDYGQVLRFEGLNLPSAYTVHFANQPMSGNAKTQVGGADGVQIARKAFGAFPDLTPEPEPEPEEGDVE